MECINCGERVVKARNDRWYHQAYVDHETGDSVCVVNLGSCGCPKPDVNHIREKRRAI